MDVVEIIRRKRDGTPLTTEEIAHCVSSYADGRLPDYQMSALAMAVFLRGMDARETSDLTHHMLHSGRVMEWAPGPPVVDKHSTGGVGDKVSLILAPLLAACGLRVPMISGRGLGTTGGTLDKLEAIPGFRTDLSIEELQAVVNDVGCVITGASREIAPADRKLYALRDVTATVASIPLITASIMSKKLAERLDALVLDVKFGSGAFMKTLDEARRLAESLVSTGRRLDVKTSALLTDMNQPLGHTAGNALEVDESIDVLKGGGPADVRELTIALGVPVLVSTGVADSRQTATEMLAQRFENGDAYAKFEQMVNAQGGDLAAPRPLGERSDVIAASAGFVHSIDTAKLGQAVIALGGGRRKLEDSIDHSVGLKMLARIGDQVAEGQPWVTVFYNPQDDTRRAEAEALCREAVTIDEQPVERLQLIVDEMAE